MNPCLGRGGASKGQDNAYWDDGSFRIHERMVLRQASASEQSTSKTKEREKIG